MSLTKKSIEVCFSPALFPYYKNDQSIVVVVDILRATTSICMAFHNGIKELIPVSDIEKAKEYKSHGFLVAAERDGLILDFADIGNSPEDFAPAIVAGKTIAYSTTNGTQAINMTGSCFKVVIGSFLNISALIEWLCLQEKDIVIFCSGWKNKFNLEDSVFAGALTKMLLETDRFQTNCDAALASLDLWETSKSDILLYMSKASHRSRLVKLKKDYVIPLCFSMDITRVIPVLKGNVIVNVAEHNR